MFDHYTRNSIVSKKEQSQSSPDKHLNTCLVIVSYYPIFSIFILIFIVYATVLVCVFLLEISQVENFFKFSSKTKTKEFCLPFVPIKLHVEFEIFLWVFVMKNDDDNNITNIIRDVKVPS